MYNNIDIYAVYKIKTKNKMLLYNTMIVYIFSCYRFCLVMGLLTFMLLTTNAQDRWRDHLPYHMGTYVTQVRNDFFCATEGGGLIIYKTDDNSIEKLSKANGLSDIGVSIIKYDNKTDLTLIAYLNGNIDILKNNEIINLPYIKNKDIVGKKTIHNIHFHDKKAYLACDFGIVVVDLIKLEIKEQYFIGEFGNQIKINAITTDKESIYAASEQGLYKASLASPNLIDYSQWSRINDIPDPTGEFSHIEYFAEKIFVVKADTLSEILFYDNNTWDNFRPSAYSGRNITFLDLANGQMSLVTDNSQIDFYKASELNSPAFQYTKTNIQQGTKSTDNNYYIAVFHYGMVKTNEITEHYFFPNGPAYKDAYRMDSEGDVVWVAAGSPANPLSRKGAYYFLDGLWHPFTQGYIPELVNIPNLSSVIINSQKHAHVWLGPSIFGLVEVFNYQVKNHFTDLNSFSIPVPNLSPGAAVGISVNFL